MAHLDPEIVKLGTEPISASAPAGESVRYDPQFEQLSSEIVKTESLTPIPIDWNTVAQLSTAILKAKSKDYRVASYLALGLYQTRGFEGLLSALAAYQDLLVNFWETAFPEKARMRGRVGAVQWLSERLPVAMTRKKATGSDDLVLELEQAALSFVATVEQCFANDAPPFVDVLQPIQALADEVRGRRAADEAARQQAEQKQNQPQAPAAVEETIDPADIDRVLEDCRTRLFSAAAVVMSSDVTSPLPFQITRGVTWGWLAALPPSDGGVTMLPPLNTTAAERIEQLSAARDWLGVVREGESGFAERVFGFDLQRHSVQALTELGERGSAARMAVVTALQALLRRLPGLLQLKFSDGTPFFSPVTLNWVNTEILIGGGTGGDRRDGAPDAELGKAVSEALRLSASGELAKGIALFKDGISRASNRRDRFLWRLELGKLCMDSGKAQLALPILTLLDEEVVRFSLEEWEPELSLAAVQQLFRCRQTVASTLPERPPDVERQLRELYQRICRIDVNAALTVDF
jgi:type VI secretion system protein VasJ